MQVLVASYLLKDSDTLWHEHRCCTQPDSTNNESFADLTKALIEHFKLHNEIKNAHDKLLRLHQTHSIAKYTKEFEMLVLQLQNLTHEEKVHYYLKGLK